MENTYRKISKNRIIYQQFSFLTLNNEDKSGKDPKRFPQHGKASLLCTNSLDLSFSKNEFQRGFENFRKSNFHTNDCLSQTSFSKLSTESLN